MKKIFFVLLAAMLLVTAKAQFPYYSTPGPYGQTSFVYQLSENVLYAAYERFTVTSTIGQSTVAGLFSSYYDQDVITVPVTQSTVITINFTGKGGAPIATPQGDVYVHFFNNFDPDEVTGRVQVQGGTWYDLTDWEDVTNEWPYTLIRGRVSGSFTDVVKLEITVASGTFDPTKIAQLEYILDKTGQVERGLITKFNSNTLWKDLTFKDTTNTTKAYVKSNGDAYFKGRVGIGTTNVNDTNYKFFVEGAIHARKLRVDQSAWPDYVFEKDYPLLPLKQVENYIQQHKHLPGVPAAAVIEKEGVDVGNTQAVLLKKIEELTLYVIEQNKKIEAQQAQLKQQQQAIEQLKQQAKKKK